MTIRVCLPAHLRVLAGVEDEIAVEVSAAPVTTGRILDAIEGRYPVLRGTMRDQQTSKRRDFVRFFACEQDLSLLPATLPVPEAVADGREAFVVVGAIAGG